MPPMDDLGEQLEMDAQTTKVVRAMAGVWVVAVIAFLAAFVAW
jgi:hypothetical protein